MRLFLDKLPVIIVLSSIVILGLIIIWMVKMPPKMRYKAWIAIVLTAILSSSLMFLSGSWRRNFYDTYRYDTVEEMVKTCMPGETIDDILYYDKYAIIFLNDTEDASMQWFPAVKDLNGWKGIDINNINFNRFIGNFNNGNFRIIEVDVETGLDFIAYYPYKKYEEETKNIIFDSENSEFKYLKLSSGYELCYTFVDIDKSGYGITVHGETLKMDEIDFRFSHMYDYGWHNKKLN
ncbi:MAG: hypothetical protein ACLVKR_08230 [Lachnospiraceae bacterium]